MTKKHLMITFLAAGLILALIAGVYVYQTHKAPSREEIEGLLTDFTEKIASGDPAGARELLTEESRGLLRDPGTTLGKTIYRELKLKSVENILTEGGEIYTADVVLTTPDTLKIMAGAGILFAERVTEDGPAEDPDQLMSDIYDEILSRDDLPMIDHFCVVRVMVQNGKLRIGMDETLQQVIEGESAAIGNMLDKLQETGGRE